MLRPQALACLVVLATATPPAVSPIHALSVASESATHYSVTAEDPNGKTLTYQWRLIPPTADHACNHFSSSGNTAVWHHGDQDGCDHNLQVAQGYAGTVILVVTDGDFSCTATYFGTITGDGPPAACTPLAPATPSATATPTSSPGPAAAGIPAWQIAVAIVVFLAVAGGVGWFFLSSSTAARPR